MTQLIPSHETCSVSARKATREITVTVHSPGKDKPMTDETAKILADALTKLNNNIGALSMLTKGVANHVQVQTENTEMLLRLIISKGAEEAVAAIGVMSLKKRKKLYEDIITKLRAELKLDEAETEKPAETKAEEPKPETV
jgi:hypothetical protein